MRFCRFKHIVLHEIPYWIKCRLWKRYNVLKIKSLPCTWTDRDHIMIHAMFQVLSDFIEKEDPDNHFHPTESEFSKISNKMHDLLDWWKNVYLKFDAWEGIKLDCSFDDNMFIPCKDHPELYEMKPFSKKDKKKMDLIQKREVDMAQELEKKLRELLDIRKFMWT